MRVPADDRTITYQIKMAYSTDLRIELVERVPGSCWDLHGRCGVHHSGCWSADLAADSERLVALGFPIVAHGVDEAGGVAVFSYHQVPGSGLFELVGTESRAQLAAIVRGDA